MKLSEFPTKLTPLYVLATGIIGSIIPVFIYTRNYPHEGDIKGEAFVSVPEYWVWLFMFMFLFALLAIFFIPAWLSLIQNFRVRILSAQDVSYQKALLKLIAAALLLICFLWVINKIASESNLLLMTLYPDGHKLRTQIVSACMIIVLIPIVLVMLMLGDDGQRLLKKVQENGIDPEQVFPIIDELLELRRSLQNHLMIAGLILSMIPLVTAGLRSIIIAIDDANQEIFPITIVIVYGLAFTSLLVYIYVPAHLSLTECSRKIRDILCPINSLDELEDTLKRRKALDELLQTNIGIGQNLKSGVATLAPLVTGLVVSLLGFNP